VLIDAVNPILMGGPEELGRGLLIGHTTSAAEEVASWVPNARVVKCFNTLGAQHLGDGRLGQNRMPMFLCGDDADAKGVVTAIVRDLGFEPVDAGPLRIVAGTESNNLEKVRGVEDLAARSSAKGIK